MARACAASFPSRGTNVHPLPPPAVGDPSYAQKSTLSCKPEPLPRKGQQPHQKMNFQKREPTPTTIARYLAEYHNSTRGAQNSPTQLYTMDIPQLHIEIDAPNFHSEAPSYETIAKRVF
ncbi:uncharacterized protein [Gossypium hirsutum]|uniref:Uncharacterized protein n=1 Tax=Gossypium hirsutum TaxID=3635 RepID=A0ABM2ZL26_GOSHI|nr:uncharacterized protein LOC107921943 [Gossypium hirsutum]